MLQLVKCEAEFTPRTDWTECSGVSTPRGKYHAQPGSASASAAPGATCRRAKHGRFGHHAWEDGRGEPGSSCVLKRELDLPTQSITFQHLGGGFGLQRSEDDHVPGVFHRMWLHRGLFFAGLAQQTPMRLFDSLFALADGADTASMRAFSPCSTTAHSPISPVCRRVRKRLNSLTR